MIEYKIISYFNYKNREYILLSDKRNKFFFLKNDVVSNCKRYITMEEFVELSNKLCIRENDLMHFSFEQKEIKKIRIIPKIVISGLVIPLTFSVLQFININDNSFDSSGISYAQESELDKNSQEKLDKFYQSIEFDKETLKEKSIDEYISTFKMVYDSDGLDQVLGIKKEDVTYDDIRQAVNNLDIPDKYKKIYLDLANNLEKQYPNLDLRIWNENLKTLKIEELSDSGLKALGVEYGAYSKKSNTIYVQDDYEFIPGTDEYQIIVHEMTHPIRLAKIKIDDVIYVCGFNAGYDNYTIVDEMMTSILSLRSYDQEESRIGYAFQTHMLELILECMDNYTLEDYVNEDVAYFIEKLNETNGDEEAIRMLNLLQLNRDDHDNDEIYFSQEQYYPLYDYVAKMYYRKNINSNMTSEEITAVKDTLVTRIITDVPEATAKEFDAAHFDDYLVEYCNENGINYSPSTKVR